MKIYKSEKFRSHEEVTAFLNEKHIPKDDIVFITRTDYWVTLYFLEEE